MTKSLLSIGFLSVFLLNTPFFASDLEKEKRWAEQVIDSRTV